MTGSISAAMALDVDRILTEKLKRSPLIQKTEGGDDYDLAQCFVQGFLVASWFQLS